jgi:hypothetical protein
MTNKYLNKINVYISQVKLFDEQQASSGVSGTTMPFLFAQQPYEQLIVYFEFNLVLFLYALSINLN